MNLLTFQNPYGYFQFFYVYENTVLKKNRGYNSTTVSSITQKILVCDEEYCDKNESRKKWPVEKRLQEKWPMEKRAKEKMADGKKAEGENRKNNMKSNFSTTANIFVNNFFSLIGFEL